MIRVQPTKETGKLSPLVEHIFNRYQEIESTLPLLSRELTYAERKALRVVSRSGKITIGKIGETLGTPPSTTTWIVGGLTKREIFKRAKDSKDKRRVFIELSEKGEALARLMERIPDRIAADLLYKLDSDERSQFVDLVESALSRIEEAGALK